MYLYNVQRENDMTKTIAAIHDLSCFGRCALTVVIPVLSAMGYQVIPLPTAVLSTHTGEGYTNFTFLDLTDEMKKITAHWADMNLSFDAIYSGFIGNGVQADIIIDFIRQFKTKDTLVLVDPVLGDDGVPYATITEEIRNKMKELTRQADIITPNITEASFLLDMPVTDPSEMVYRLAETTRKVVLTGVHIDDCIGTVSYERETDKEPAFFLQKRIDKSYPGTGDIFASVLLGKLMSGLTLNEAAGFASDFISEVIKDTAQYDFPERYGVLIEKNLYKLIKDIKL